MLCKRSCQTSCLTLSQTYHVYCELGQVAPVSLLLNGWVCRSLNCLSLSQPFRREAGLWHLSIGLQLYFLRLALILPRLEEAFWFDQPFAAHALWQTWWAWVFVRWLTKKALQKSSNHLHRQLCSSTRLYLWAARSRVSYCQSWLVAEILPSASLSCQTVSSRLTAKLSIKL